MAKVRTIGYSNYHTRPVGQIINIVSHMAAHGNKAHHTTKGCHSSHSSH